MSGPLETHFLIIVNVSGWDNQAWDVVSGLGGQRAEGAKRLGPSEPASSSSTRHSNREPLRQLIQTISAVLVSSYSRDSSEWFLLRIVVFTPTDCGVPLNVQWV